MSNLEREMFEIRRLAASTATLLQRHINAETMQEAAKQTEEMIRREYPHEGNRWSPFEKDLLYRNIISVVKDLSLKFGRSPNAIWWAIYKLASHHKVYRSSAGEE